MIAQGSQREGDTQPYSQSVYDKLLNKSESRGVSTQAPAATGNATHSHGATPFTYSQGNTGHIDLLAAFEQPTLEYSEEGRESDSGDDHGGKSQMDVRAQPYPESERFKQTKTPATQGRRRTRAGEIINPDSTTPGLPTNPFAEHIGQAGGIMDLSQVFQTTQAASSPPLNRLPSDAMSERPSPGFFPVQRPSTADSLSSPVKIPHAYFSRAVTEPQTNYISMKASQAERERQLMLQRLAAVTHGSSREELSDDDFESQGSLLRRRMNQKRIESMARDEFIGITAPSRPGSRGYGRGTGVKSPKDHHPPHSSKGRLEDAVVISDDMNAEETGGNATEEETEHEEDDDAIEIGPPGMIMEEDKENFDFSGVQVPMTTSRNAIRVSPQGIPQDSPSSHRHRGPSPGLHNKLYGPMDEDACNRSSGSTDKIEINLGGSQTVAIADSQPSQSRTKDWNMYTSAPLLNPVPISSSQTRAIIPQSQSDALALTTPLHSSRARQLKELDTSSLPPGPPPISSPNHNSSPSLPQHNCNNLMLEAALKSSPPQLQPLENAPRPQPTPVSSHHPINQDPGNVLPLPTEGISDDTPETEVPAKAREDKAGPVVDHYSARKTRFDMVTECTLRSTIPESSSSSSHIRGSMSSAPVPRAVHASSQPQRSFAKSSDDPQPQRQSTGSTMFETAQTDLSGSPIRSRFRSSRQQSAPPRASASPQLKRTRTLTEIATDPTPPDAIRDVDIDVGLITSEAMPFQAAIEGSSPIGPARKRRRGRDGRVLRVAESQPNQLPPAMITDTQEREDDGGQAAAAARQIAMRQHLADGVKNRVSASLQAQSLGGTRGALATEKPATKAVASGIARHRTNYRSSPALFEDHPPQQNQIGPPLDKVGLEKESELGNHEIQSEVTNVGGAIEEEVVAPNRVFAHFNGNNAAYYPATCLGVTVGKEARYKVRFDDGTIAVISGYAVKKLNLRKGDSVKVDLPGARTKTYIVEGFRGKKQPLNDPKTPSRSSRPHSGETFQYPKVDLHGYATVMLSVKQRQPSPNEHHDRGHMAVGITSVYLTPTMWTSFKDHVYSYVPDQQSLVLGLRTPSQTVSAATTPSSRTRRPKLSMSGRATSSTLSILPSRTGLSYFNDIVFAVSQIEQEEKRKQTIDHIITNGGRLVDGGFDELFIIPGFEPTSPSKRSLEKNNPSFRLNHQAEDLGFTCLIADKHGRKTKYIQALALGIPCLATRWVHDCVTKQRLLPWEPYLLPSGESTFLGGAVRSRMLPSYKPDSARLATIIESRPQWLSGRSVLLIMGEEKRKAYLFLTHALGAEKVARAISLEAGKKMLSEAAAMGEEWDWIYVEGSEENAERVLFGAENGRKRKRGRSEGWEGGRSRKTKIVGDQFVIQSLILGTLMDEE